MAGTWHVVFGAAGGTGSALVAELVRQNKPVRAVYRRPQERPPAGVDVVVADAGDPDSARRAAEGAAVVYNAVNVGYSKWIEMLPTISASLSAAASATGARFVYADNLYCYGPTRGTPMSETTPLGATGPKGRLRIRLAEDLLAAHRAGHLDVAIARSSDFYGPNGLNAAAGERVFGAALKGKKPSFIGKPGVPHTYSYLPDMARAMVILAERDEASGEVWHLPADKALTGEEFAALMGETLGRPLQPSYLPGILIDVAGIFVREIREVKEQMYEFNEPYILDSSKFQGAFGPFAATPHKEAIKATLDWYRSARQS